MINKVVFLSVFFCAILAQAASKDLILRFKDKASADQALSSSQLRHMKVEVLIPELNMYLVKAPATRDNGARLRQGLRSLSGVTSVVQDYEVKMRASIPNDVSYVRQWSLSSGSPIGNIDAVNAWDISKGGPNALNQDPVIAIVDGGMDITHPDLVDNLWVNKNEIPGNGIDDDNDGYVDDVNGWNVFSDNGEIKPDAHGTHVAGIAGARGNNGIGVTGINWDAKIMFVAGSSGNFSVVAKAYGYVIRMKKLWIESKGMLGANIVVTNSSFGVDYADCMSAQYIDWNDIYNKMGEYGILSAAATANLNIDVDVKGDVPTGCQSDYVISVTNTTQTDEKNRGAAFGLKSVDLGAPGTAIFSSLPRGNYGELTGTSMATPHVAGAVALMHSAASRGFAQYYQDHPALAALQLKQVLLSTVDVLEPLKLTVSGGRLNLYRAVKQMSVFEPPTFGLAGR